MAWGVFDLASASTRRARSQISVPWATIMAPSKMTTASLSAAKERCSRLAEATPARNPNRATTMATMTSRPPNPLHDRGAEGDYGPGDGAINRDHETDQQARALARSAAARPG